MKGFKEGKRGTALMTERDGSREEGDSTARDEAARRDDRNCGERRKKARAVPLMRTGWTDAIHDINSAVVGMPFNPIIFNNQHPVTNFRTACLSTTPSISIVYCILPQSSSQNRIIAQAGAACYPPRRSTTFIPARLKPSSRPANI
ncbi:hypothetical protein Slin14017_G121920 [Septoria linicola]|nr:hypothetical protein Slin14017_G121920 [Septoria linicola]